MAIHASKKRSRELDELSANNPHFRSALIGAALMVEQGDQLTLTLPLGAVVAACRLVDVKRTEEVRDKLDEAERAFGDYGNGRFAWILADVVRLPKPIPCRGALGLPELSLVLSTDRVKEVEAFLAQGGCHVHH